MKLFLVIFTDFSAFYFDISGTLHNRYVIASWICHIHKLLLVYISKALLFAIVVKVYSYIYFSHKNWL